MTGMRSEITTDLTSIVATIRENTRIPCAVGLESPRLNRQPRWQNMRMGDRRICDRKYNGKVWEGCAAICRRLCERDEKSAVCILI